MAFFATSHEKNACYGVGGTIKRFAASVSLQRPITDQILNPIHLFEFVKNEITGVTCAFVDTSDVEKISLFLQPRFTNSPKFKGTRKNQQFIPYGNGIVMKRVSGSTGFETTMITNLPLNDLKIEDIAPVSFYDCQYENDWYLSIANFVSMENQDLNIKFLHPKGPAVQFFWPSRDEICWIPISNVICKVQPPESSTTCRFYEFHSGDISHIKSLINLKPKCNIV